LKQFVLILIHLFLSRLKSVEEVLLLQHVGLDLHIDYFVDYFRIAPFDRFFQFELFCILSRIDLVFEHAVPFYEVLALALKGEKVILRLLVLLRIAISASRKASLANVGVFTVEIRDLTNLLAFKDGVSAYKLPLLFHFYIIICFSQLL
jgi:hypothetical protein